MGKKYLLHNLLLMCLLWNMYIHIQYISVYYISEVHSYMQFHSQTATGNLTAFVFCWFCLLMLQGVSLYLYPAVMALGTQCPKKRSKKPRELLFEAETGNI